jgi:hypothetical protein
MPPKQKTTWDTMVESGQYGPLASATPSVGAPPVSAITPQALTPSAPITPVTAPITTVPPAPALTPPVEAPKTDLYAPSATENRLYSAMQKLQGDTNAFGSREAFTDKSDTLYGVQEKEATTNKIKNEFDALTQEVNAVDLQYKQDLDNLQLESQGRGITAGGLAPKQRELATKANQAKLTIAINQHKVASEYALASGELAKAISLSDRAVRMEYQPKKDALDAQRANLELALKDPTLTQEQKKRADAQALAIDAEKAKIAKEEKNAQDTNDARIKAINVNLGNPQLAKAMDTLRASKTPLDVAGVLAFYGLNAEKDTGFELSAGQTRYDSKGNVIASRPKDTVSTDVEGGPSGIVQRDADSVMNGTLNLQDISVKDNYRASVAAQLATKQKEALASGDMAGVMRSSAAFDKEVSDTFLQSMEKTLAVVSQIGVLQENIAGTDTGPIVGAFRGANPWDTNAQTIKAQLNAIVPNLARGVYGEVGVLTDNDIKQYTKTIPTLTSTDDVRNAILYITLNQIRKNVEIKIKNQASGQRDMSGYADIYANLNQQVDDVLSTLPQGASQESKATPEQASLRTKYGY